MKAIIPSEVPPHRVTTMEEYDALHRESIEQPEKFWAKQMGLLYWFHPPYSVLDANSEESDVAWFSGGKLNASVNCVDRHVAEKPNQTAIIWAKNEPGEYQHITYRDLKHRVGKVANVLRSLGIGKGDRVCIYLPMVPELVYTMLACARIGAVHSVVFAGFSADSLRDRIVDAGAKIVVTADEGLRGAKRIPLKAICDQAIDGVSSVANVLVVRRTGGPVAMRPDRDLWLEDEMRRQRATCPAEWMSSEDPLFMLYTSGSTGRPKGVMHTTAGYLLYAALTHRWIFDMREGDVHFCTADLGWITGHTYVVYGPLANGATTVLFESLPNYPDAGRYWQVADDLQATSIYTSPTALRLLMRDGDEPVRKYSRKSLRILGTAGEPINPQVWRWYHEVVGDRRASVVDTWWQTETGGIMITPLPGVTPPKAGSATRPFFGIKPMLVDDRGRVLEGPAEGNLCIGQSWPGQARTIHGDHQRYRETYFSQFPELYFTGDGCRRDEDGDYWITGRVDDVLNVSGHRIGTAEVESSLVAHEAVAEAAVVGFPHEIKGQGLYAYVVLRTNAEEWEPGQLVGALKEKVRRTIGAFATPDQVEIVPGLPKTRSGKIMRRLLRKVVEGSSVEELGDLTTLADPAVLDSLIHTEHRARPGA